LRAARRHRTLSSRGAMGHQFNRRNPPFPRPIERACVPYGIPREPPRPGDPFPQSLLGPDWQRAALVPHSRQSVNARRLYRHEAAGTSSRAARLTDPRLRVFQKIEKGSPEEFAGAL